MVMFSMDSIHLYMSVYPNHLGEEMAPARHIPLKGHHLLAVGGVESSREDSIKAELLQADKRRVLETALVGCRERLADCFPPPALPWGAPPRTPQPTEHEKQDKHYSSCIFPTSVLIAIYRLSLLRKPNQKLANYYN